MALLVAPPLLAGVATVTARKAVWAEATALSDGLLGQIEEASRAAPAASALYVIALPDGLPLGESDLLREGAQHVVSMRLTQRATRSYVQNTLQAYRDKAPESRLTPRLVATSLRKARLRITETAARRRIRQFAGKYDPAERKLLVAEIDALLGALREVKRELARK